MKLKEIFDQLTYGELSQISIGGGAMGQIMQADYARMAAHVNLGLAALHRRFALKEGRIKIELQPGQTRYPLLSKYAVSSRSSREAVRFIKDSTASPFLDDINKIEFVYSDIGFEYAVNNAVDQYSMATPTQKVLEVPMAIVLSDDTCPEAMWTKNLEVVYRASPLKVGNAEGDFDPEEVEVELPETHLNALLLFVASRIHTPVGIGGEDNTGNLYWQKYEAECDQLDQDNYEVDQGSQYNKIERNGWV